MIRRAMVAASVGLLLAQPAAAQRPESPAAVKRYFETVRREFSAKNAYDQVAFMDRYFRWPGNTGFDASIDRVEGIVKAAGYVSEATARPTDALTYRIERRRMNAPALASSIYGPPEPPVRVRGPRRRYLSWTGV